MRGILIGNPVDRSISTRTHPKVFERLGLSATYEKRLIRSSEEICDLRREGFDWIAVTMPYKEVVLSWIDQLDEHAEAIGAVNMIHRCEGKWIGYNTDAGGALDALEKKVAVRGKKLVILGAGGTAKAIAYEARRRGASVFLFNRTQERALKIGEELKVGCVKTWPFAYDILINATSVGMGSELMPIDPKFLIPKTTVMDVVYSPRVTALLEAASKMACDVVTGLEMFLELTFQQLRIVFGQKVKREVVESVIFEEVCQASLS